MRAALLLLLATPALADSPDAWAAFQAEVEAACRVLVDEPGEVSVEVSPFGSESYGAALVTLAGPEGTDRMACILDKATRRAELAAPFPPEDAPAPDPAP